MALEVVQRGAKDFHDACREPGRYSQSPQAVAAGRGKFASGPPGCRPGSADLDAPFWIKTGTIQVSTSARRIDQSGR